MKVPNKSDLIHFKIQAALREHNVPKEEIEYMGQVSETGQHMYMIAGEHLVSADQIEEFERVDEEQ